MREPLREEEMVRWAVNVRVADRRECVHEGELVIVLDLDRGAGETLCVSEIVFVTE